MSAIDLQIALRCGACASVVPVNAFAAHVVCWSCERGTPLDGATWQLLLEAPLREGPALAANVERNASLRSGVGVFERSFRSGDPVCVACRSPISADDLRALAAKAGGSKRAHCPQCNHGVLVRPAPESLSAAGVAAIVGESEEQLAGATGKRAPVPLACTQCGGALQVDGAQRTVQCPFCSSTQYLPEALWISLRSTPVLQWTLVLGEAASRARRSETKVASWSQLHDVVSDPQGNLYCFGMADMSGEAGQDARDELRAMMRAMGAGGGPEAMVAAITYSVWCMSGDGTLRWQRTGINFHWSARLAWAPSGHLLLRDASHTHVLQASDGKTVHRFGQDGPPIEVANVRSFTVDADGTIVMLDDEDRLVRFASNGTPMALWGSGAQKLGKGDARWVHEVGKKPLMVHRGLVATGWDGHLWIQSIIGFDDGCHLASFERSGARRFIGRIPVPKSTLFESRPAIDGHGAAYVIVDHVREGGSDYSIERLEPGGKRARTFAAPMIRGGTLGAETRIAASSDGTVYALGDGGRLRVFGQDGSVRHIAQRSADADRAQ